MSIITNIKFSIGEKILNSKMKKISRKRGIFNFTNAKTIGIVFNATTQKSFDEANNFIKLLEQKKIKVTSIGFVDSKEVRDFYRETLFMSYFSKKNINWYGKPRNERVEMFVNQDFDILIDLSIINEFPIKYISAMSLAKFKVGKQTENEKYLDFMIDISKKTETEYLIEQITHYLSMINIK